MKHLFIVNPAAGGQNSTALIEKMVSAAFKGREDTYEIYTTRAPMDAYGKIRTLAAESGDELRIYACGGDGTLNECVNGAANQRHLAVTHVPIGTGNDFIKTFFGERGADIKKVSAAANGAFSELSALLDGEVREMDLIEVNGRYCLNISSVGLDARIGGEVHRYSRRFRGNAAYAASAAVNIARGINMRLRVRFGNNTFSDRFTMICACNGRYYGGMFNPMPEAKPDDGIIEFLLLRHMSRLEFLQHVRTYAQGRYEELGAYITHLRGTRLDIDSDHVVDIVIDGEIMRARKFSFSLVPGAVRFIFPRGLRYFEREQAGSD